MKSSNENCVFLGDIGRTISKASAIVKAAPFGNPGGMRRSADEMDALASEFGRISKPRETNTLDLRMNVMLADYAEMLRAMAANDENGYKSAGTAAMNLRKEMGDDITTMKNRYGCK